MFLQVSDCQTNTKTQNTGVFSTKRAVGESDAILQRVVVKFFFQYYTLQEKTGNGKLLPIYPRLTAHTNIKAKQ
jgi:hypothetical protein